MTSEDSCFLAGKPWQTGQRVEKQGHYSADKGSFSQGYGLPVVTYGYESWSVKKAEHQRIDAFEQWCWGRLPKFRWTARRVSQLILKGNQSWIFIGKTEAEAQTPVFWSHDVMSWLIGKVPDAGKDWGQEKRASENEMAGWHHQCNGRELGQTLGDDEGQWGLACCSLWGRKESDMTGSLNNNNNNNKANCYLFVDMCSVVQSCLTLCNPMDCSPPGSSVHRISQAGILEQVAISSSRGSF